MRLDDGLSLIHSDRLRPKVTFVMLLPFEQAPIWADIRGRDGAVGREDLEFVVVRVGSGL